MEPKAVICSECYKTLEEFYKFKKQCLKNEKRMRNLYPSKSNNSSSMTKPKENEVTHSKEISSYSETNEEIANVADELSTVSVERFQKVNKSGTDTPPKQDSFSKIPTAKFGLPALEKMLVLSGSYGNFFHFEKRPRSIYYNLVIYGERYNSAVFSPRLTYWQCIHRKKHHCKAQICCTNDYKDFERRHSHSHGQLPEKSGIIFQPSQVLPEIFKICREHVKKVNHSETKINSQRKKSYLPFFLEIG